MDDLALLGGSVCSVPVFSAVETLVRFLEWLAILVLFDWV